MAAMDERVERDVMNGPAEPEATAPEATASEAVDQDAVDQDAIDERNELAALRAEVARLRAEQAHRRQPGRFVRPTAAGLLIVLGCVLAVPAVVAVWLRSQVTDTDRYVATVAPLADDPAVQRAVTDRVTTEIFSRIDVAGLTRQAADALEDQGVPPPVANSLRALAQPVANGVQGWVHDQVGGLVASDQFAEAWETANRAAHAELVSVLTGENSGVLVTEGDTVSVKLATFVAAVKERLVARGFTIAERIPTVDTEIVIFQSADIGRAQRAFSLLNSLGTWLPVVAVGLLVIGVLTARGRRRAIIGAGLGMALAMLAVAIALAVIRPIYLNAVPDTVLPADAAAAVFDTVVWYLRITLRAVLALGLLVALGAFLTGPAPAAVTARRWSAATMAKARERRRQAGAAHRAGRHLDRTAPAGPAGGGDRRRGGGVRLLGLPDRPGGHRPGSGGAGRDRPDRVSRRTARAPGRPHRPDRGHAHLTGARCG